MLEQQNMKNNSIYNCIKVIVNLTKVKDFGYTENCKTEWNWDTNKWKYILCSCIGRINIVKMSIICKALTRCSAISIKILMAYIMEVEQI